MTINVRSVSSAQDAVGYSVSAPAGVQAGDLLIAVHFGNFDNSDAAMTASTDFTQLGSTFNDPNNSFIKVWSAPGSATAPYPFGNSGLGVTAVLAINQANATTPIDVAPVFNAGQGLDAQVAPSVVPISQTFLLICGFCSDMGGTWGYTPAYGMTKKIDSGGGVAAPFTATVQTQVVTSVFGVVQPTGTRCAPITGTLSDRYAAVSLVIAQ